MALTDKLKAIADAIREQTGNTGLMTLDEMAEMIRHLSASGTILHNIVLNLTNCVSSNTAAQAAEHSSYTTVISAVDGYTMNLLTVTMGDEVLTPDNGAIHIADVTGEIQITASAVAVSSDGVDLSGVVAWYQEPTRDAIEYVQGLGDGWVHHAVITDSHYTAYNYRHSLPIINVFQSTGLFSKAILLGDNLDTNDETAWQNVMDDGLAELAGDVLCARGNHDSTTQTWIREKLLTNDDLVFCDDTNLSYYWDDTEHKIRYFVMDVTDNGGQKTWAQEKFKELGEGWAYIFLAHYPTIAGTDAATGKAIGAAQSSTSGFDGYTIPYSWNVSADCICWVNGHCHNDNFTESAIGFRQMMLNTDCNKCYTGVESGIEGVSDYDRGPETVGEQAVTIMSINPATKDIHFYRIGSKSQTVEFPVACNYGVRKEGWVADEYISSAGEFKTFAGAALNLTPYTWTSGDVWYFWDDEGYPLYMQTAAFAGATFLGSARGSNSYFAPSERGHNVALLWDRGNTMANGGCDKFYFSFNCADDAGFTAIDRVNGGHVRLSKEVPKFIDKTPDVVGWAENTVISNNSYADDATSQSATSAKTFYCEPGKTVTLRVDNAEFATDWIYMYCVKGPVMTPNGGQLVRKGFTKVDEQTYTFVQPDGYYYCVISARNLTPYLADTTVSIE